MGSGGILPAADYLEAAQRQLGAQAYLRLPTLLWLDSGDTMLQALCGAGVFVAGMVVLGVAPAPCLALLWATYLSLINVGRDFLSFQWDILLLEAGFLALLWAPASLRPARLFGGLPSTAVLWLIRLLLFRLMIFSGLVKLLSGDPSWRDLTALSFHYLTQPLPHVVSWFAHQLPAWLHRVVALQMFAIELAVPLLIFAPRRWRLLGVLQWCCCSWWSRQPGITVFSTC